MVAIIVEWQKSTVIFRAWHCTVVPVPKALRYSAARTSVHKSTDSMISLLISELLLERKGNSS
jgi:hypothetical protein